MSNQHEVHFFVFNIRLLTDHQRTSQSYQKLFLKLFSMREPIAVRKPCYMMFRTMKERSIAGQCVLKGRLYRFSKIERNECFNVQEASEEEHAIPRELFQNLKETEYIFIPAIHRFCLLSQRKKAALSSVQQFLEAGLNRVAREDEEVHVTLEKSRDFLEDILGAPHISNIELRISFSNQDLNDEYTNLVDNQLRDAEIEYLEISGRAREGKSVDLQRSKFLMGAAGLVPSNGGASARIVNRKGRAETVDTSDYPRRFRLAYNGGEKLEMVVRCMMKTYRRRDEA